MQHLAFAGGQAGDPAPCFEHAAAGIAMTADFVGDLLQRMGEPLGCERQREVIERTGPHRGDNPLGTEVHIGGDQRQPMDPPAG